jgi:hypothetical protein
VTGGEAQESEVEPGGESGDAEWVQDPELVQLGQEFRAELRAEAEEYEQLAVKDHLRNRRLGDVALELVHRGDHVAVTTGGQTFRGIVVYAAGDLATVRTPAGDVDLNLGHPLAIRVTERVRSGGAPRGRGPASFIARVHEHEAAGTTVDLGCPLLATDLRGRIEAAGRDHLMLIDAEGQEWFLASNAVSYVRPVP